MNIGFWGAGLMGSGLARNLLKKGHRVILYSRDMEKVKKLAAFGDGLATDKFTDLFSCECVISCVARPEYLEEKFLDSDFYARFSGHTHIECSTIGPKLARTLEEKCRENALGYVQACLGKTPAMAEKAEEPVFVGGEKNACGRVWAVLEEIGKPLQVGSVTSSCAAKLLSNLIGMTNIAVLGEGMRIARACGMDMEQFLGILADTGANSFQLMVRGKMMAQAEYTPPKFRLTLAHKDMVLGEELARESGMDSPFFTLARSLYEKSLDRGLGDEDAAAICEVFEKKDLPETK